MPSNSLNLNPELANMLSLMATHLGKSVNVLVNQAVQEYLDRNHSEIQRWSETLEALDSVKAGKLVDGDRVHAWMDSWGSENEQPPPKP